MHFLFEATSENPALLLSLKMKQFCCLDAKILGLEFELFFILYTINSITTVQVRAMCVNCKFDS